MTRGNIIRWIGAIFLVLLLLGPVTGFAQQANEALIKKYNQAIELAQQQKYDEAIQAFEEAARMAESSGDTELARKAKEQVLKLYLDKALRLARAKEYESALATFQKVETLAQELGDQDILKRAQQGVAAMHYNIGRKLVTQKKFEEALQHFDKAIEIDPADPKNYYMRAFTLRQMGKDEESIQWYLKTAEVAKAAGNERIVRMALQNVGKGYIVWAARALQENKPEEAIKHLDKALEYMQPNADVHYYYAVAYNALGEYKKAVEHAQKALEMERGGRVKKARIYFELGMAYKYLGDKEKAREAFKNALYGPVKARAEYELKYLDQTG